MAQAAGRGDPYGWRQEGKSLLRAVAGGSLFGMPLLYTMEMWHQAITYAASHLLVFRMFGSTDPYLVIEVRPLPEESRREGSLYILPVEVRNTGTQTVRELKVRVRIPDPAGGNEQEDHVIEYLGEHARQKIYVYLDRDPRTLPVEARVLFYSLD